ncbi:MAG: hypothetical protein H6Q86_5188 [candidate division NC10 bacterium]|nr:hypothetical protein [candidate division NC10 bacterium]
MTMNRRSARSSALSTPLKNADMVLCECASITRMCFASISTSRSKLTWPPLTYCFGTWAKYLPSSLLKKNWMYASAPPCRFITALKNATACSNSAHGIFGRPHWNPSATSPMSGTPSTFRENTPIAFWRISKIPFEAQTYVIGLVRSPSTPNLKSMTARRSMAANASLPSVIP